MVQELKTKTPQGYFSCPELLIFGRNCHHRVRHLQFLQPIRISARSISPLVLRDSPKDLIPHTRRGLGYP